MASSQVEFASSSLFGCALRRDHRNGCNAAPFKKNLNDLVNSCNSDENSHPRLHIDYTDLWVHQPQWQTAPSIITASPDNNVIIRNGNDDDDNNNNNKNNDNDRGKIKASDEDKWTRAREMVFAGDRKSQGRVSSGSCSVLKRENSPTQSETSVEIPNLRGVSSLVQKWRDFEAESKCQQSNSSTKFAENASCIDVPSRHSDVCDDRPVSNEETFGDWESDRTVFSDPSSSMGRDSEATERERLRVADIIRKLTSCTEDREHIAGYESSSPLVRTSLDQSEQSCFSSVLCSPCIRGRGAFNNLLVQMKNERQKEIEGLVARKAVSKFSHRGRIQALLRVRFLRRGLEPRECQHLNSRSFEFKRFTQSAIAHIRERFKSGVQNGAIDSKNSHREAIDNAASAENMLNQHQPVKQNQHQETKGSLISHEEIADHVLDAETSSTCQETNVSIISHKVAADDILDEETSSTSKGHVMELDSHEVNESSQQSSFQAHGSEDLHEEASPLSDFMRQGTGCEAYDCGLTESTDTAEPLINVNKNNHAEEEDVTSNQWLTRTNHDLIDDCAHPYSQCENKLLMGIDAHWVNVSHPEDECEELHCDYQQQSEVNTDWISDISRPRSDWEDLRQARYCEMQDPFLEKEDIRVLLERRSVSTFLSSVLRENIDRLMMSRTQQRQQNVMNNLMEEIGEEQVIEEEDKGEDAVAVALEEEEDEQDEERSYSDYYDEYDESETGQLYNDYIDQSPSSAPPSWLHNQGHEVSDDSYQAASPSVHPSLSSNTYSQDNQPLSSFTNHQTIEMDLIYDLKGQMEQLHREMSELRRSIKSCINMQVKLQRSIKQEAAAAIRPSDRKERRDSRNESLSKGRCRICCEMQVDSVLYRCGHICTCFKCARELQWSSGKCPVCGDQILDVVKIHSHS